MTSTGEAYSLGFSESPAKDFLFAFESIDSDPFTTPPPNGIHKMP